jgi:predicted nucleotidyltransferase
MTAMMLPFDTSKLIEICRKNDVAMIGVFGSVARGEATASPYIRDRVKRGLRVIYEAG